MLIEGRNYGISDMLKTVYPLKTLFCGGGVGYNKNSPRQLANLFTLNYKFMIHSLVEEKHGVKIFTVFLWTNLQTAKQ